MAEGRLPLRATAMPSRWWLVLSIPAVAVLSVVVVAVVRALEPGHSPPTFTRTERFGPVADTYVDARVRDRSFGRAESLRLAPDARGYLRFSPRVRGTVVRARLRLWARGSNDGYAVHVLRDGTWTEPGVTAGRPPRPGRLVSTSAGSHHGGWVTADVTRLIPTGGPVDLALVGRGRSSAAYDSREGHHPPQLVLSSSTASVWNRSPGAALAAAATDVLGATRYRLRAHDSRGRGLRGLKVAQVGPGRYVGVYDASAHGVPSVQLATSRDLVTWRWHAVLLSRATHPKVAALPSGGFVVAARRSTSAAAEPQVRRYRDVAALMAGRPDPATGQPGCAAGVGGRPPHALDAALARAGAHGRAGDADVVRVGGEHLVLAHAPVGADRLSRPFLYDAGLGVAHPLDVRTPHRSTTFVRPTASLVRGPSGMPGVVVTLFLPRRGAAAGEAGEMIVYRELAHRAPARASGGAC